jgi:hypothetical protein
LPISRSLFIVPTRRGDGFIANLCGRTLELEDPTGHRLAPTPDDLVVLSIASDLAWSARRLLRGQGLAGDVNVTATWQTVDDPPRLADITLTVVVPTTEEATGAGILAALEERAAVRSLDDPPRIHLSYER